MENETFYVVLSYGWSNTINKQIVKEMIELGDDMTKYELNEDGSLTMDKNPDVRTDKYLIVAIEKDRTALNDYSICEIPLYLKDYYKILTNDDLIMSMKEFVDYTDNPQTYEQVEIDFNKYKRDCINSTLEDETIYNAEKFNKIRYFNNLTINDINKSLPRTNNGKRRLSYTQYRLKA